MKGSKEYEEFEGEKIRVFYFFTNLKKESCYFVDPNVKIKAFPNVLKRN